MIPNGRTLAALTERSNNQDKEMYMCDENSFVDEPTAEPVGVVELGTASEKTRGALFGLAIIDGVAVFPLLFRPL